MKRKFIYLTLFLAAIMSSCQKENNNIIEPNPETDHQTEKVELEPTNFAIISDVHYLSPSLYDEQPNSAFEEYLKSDRKMLKESDALLNAAIAKIKSRQPEFLIIPGDLTKDGEKASHNDVAQKLREIENAGTEVFVVPGNHDINNPHAVSFLAGESAQVESISKDDFATIYAEFGYEEAIAKDSNSLSYIAEPTEGVWLVCIDACKYYENDANTCVTGGAIRQNSLKWLKQQIAKGKEAGKQMFGVIHHGIVEHFDFQSTLLAEYLVDDFKQVQEELSMAGLNIVFSGHMHSQDVKKGEVSTGFIYDVETGSTVTYPCPVRFATYNFDNHLLDITTSLITDVDYDTGEINDFTEYAHTSLLTGMDDMIINLLVDNIDRIKGFLPTDGLESSTMNSINMLLAQPALVKAVLEPFISVYGLDIILGEVLAAVYKGDEQVPENFDETVGATLDRIVNEFTMIDLTPYTPTILTMIKGIYTDQPPADNNVQINCKTGDSKAL